ncbi:MAG: stress protein [Polaromonas sp.]|nr:stress protein [Polaromonas sp.]
MWFYKGIKMAVSLKKGHGVSLKKSENDLSMVTIGLGWDIQEKKKGFLGGMFGAKEAEYDLDCCRRPKVDHLKA